jgi:hypothetical protein
LPPEDVKHAGKQVVDRQRDLVRVVHTLRLQMTIKG